jgi:multidrug transporter EmrE-like cation transporter
MSQENGNHLLLMKSWNLIKFSVFYYAILFCLLYALFNVTGAAIIKQQLLGQQLSSVKDYFSLLMNYKVILAFGIVFVSSLVLFKALSLSKCSLVIPIANGINFILTVFIGLYLFHDKLSYLHLLAIFLILSGIILLGILEK